MEKIVLEFLANKKNIFGGADKTFDKFKKSHPDVKITAKAFKEIFNRQEVSQVFHQLPKPKEYLSIFSKNDNSYQADLTYMDKVGTEGGYNYLLTMIDVNSRYAYAYPLKSKNAGEVISKFQEFLKEVHDRTGSPVHSLTTDLGTEFTGNEFKDFFKNVGVELFLANAGDKNKMGKIERFHRTFKEAMIRMMHATNEPWNKLVNDVVENYNNSKHRALGHDPNEYNKEDKEKQYENYKRKYKILVGEKGEEKKYIPNQPVRIRVRQNIYGNSTMNPKMSVELYHVDHTYPSGTMSLKNKQGQLMEDTAGPIRYKPYDVKPINDTININNKFFEKIIRVRKEKKLKRTLKKAGIKQTNVTSGKRIRIRKKFHDESK